MRKNENVVRLDTNSPNLTARHKAYAQALNHKGMYPTIAYGSAGTGKTFIALEEAMKQLEKQQIRQVICIRPNVCFADSSGYLPGSEREKMEPWVRPVRQNLEKMGYNASHIENLEKNGKLKFYPLEFVQGMTFDNAFILIDECENLTFHQLKIILTRVGSYSRIVLAGDVAQVSERFRNSGLAKLIHMCLRLDCKVNLINFKEDDIIRSGQCRDWIVAFEAYEATMESDD